MVATIMFNLNVIVCSNVFFFTFSACYTKLEPPSCKTVEVGEISILSCSLTNSSSGIPAAVPNGSVCTGICKYVPMETWRLCRNGNWKIPENNCNAIQLRKRGTLKRLKRWWNPFKAIANVFRHIVKGVSCLLTLFIPRGCHGPPRDRTPPKLSCPPDIERFADPIQYYTHVSWIEPSAAYDDHDGKLIPTRSGPPPGRLFSEGNTPTRIGYYARDRSGNMARCSFSINVRAIRCPNLHDVSDGYYVCHPSDDMLLDTICRFGCYHGHDLVGPHAMKCIRSVDDGIWNVAKQPYCQKKQCPLLPIQLPPLSVTCSNERFFRSICTYSCKKGFDILSGNSRVRVCDESGYWHGAIPQCFDVEPPVISNCKAVWYGYAERSETEGRIMWREPSVSDNFDKFVSPYLISGPTPNEMLAAGSYDVIYGAKDSTGNKARSCKMKLVMRVISCSSLYNTPFLKITCPQGYKYGARCNFTCDVGSYINGTLNSEMTTSCEKATDVHYGEWDFGSIQPFCKMKQSCVKQLNVPDNGALACDNWLNGRFCQMFCKTGYDIPPGHPAYEMFVCGLSNMWKPDITLPNCHRKIGTIGVGIRMSAHYYFDGDCHNKAVILAIQESFILNLKASPYTDGCLVFAKTCSPENVEVQCGLTKKKRSVGLGIGFSFVIKFHNQNLSLDSFFTNISTQSMNLDLEINGSRYTAYDIQSSSYEVLCPDLTIPSQNHMACVICAPGSYFDKKKKTCPQCPKGMYQPMEGKEECVKCPDGTTTKSIGSKYNTSCKESCLPGSISHDGLPPCSLCKKGTYQDTYGNSSCKMCSGSKTTQTDGSSLAKECQEFDISIKDENGSFTVALQSLDVDMNFGFYISTWMMFESEASSAEILEFISSNKTSLASLSNKRTLFFSNMSNHYNMSFLVDKYKWHNYLLYLNKSNVVLFVDGSSTSNVKIGLDNIGTANLIKVGGRGFKGSISQVNIWSFSFDLTTLLKKTSRCFLSSKGDIFSWKQAELVTSRYAFTVIPSECDDYDSCISNPCHNGICTDDLVGYTCDCFIGFTGRDCEDNIDDCEKNVCQNNSTCIDGVTSFKCICKEGFKGDLCEIKVVDGHWSEWGNWSDCFGECGIGIKTKRRLCNNPTPDNGGLNCSGEATEMDKCFLGECLVCNDLNTTENGILDCRNDTGNINCTYRCKSGYDFDHDPKDFYICGPDTFYLWDFQTKDNPYGRLPSCTPIKAAKTVVIKYYAKYEELTCDDSNWMTVTDTIKNQINKTTKSFNCIVNDTCTLVNASATNCNGYRHKRDLNSQTSGLSVEFACNPKQHGSEYCAQALLKVFNDMIELAELGQLDVYILRNRHRINVNTTTISDKILCDDGAVSINYYCIPCSIGRFFYSDECKECEYGYYQDQTGQIFCKPCPVGTTTSGRASVSETECSVKTVIPKDKLWNYGLIIGLAFAGVIVFGAIALTCRKAYSYKHRKVGDSSISRRFESKLGPANRKFLR